MPGAPVQWSTGTSATLDTHARRIPMSDSKTTKPVTRRAALQAGLTVAALPPSGVFARYAAAQAKPATKEGAAGARLPH